MHISGNIDVNGQREFITSDTQFADLIEENMGVESRWLFEDIVATLQSEISYLNEEKEEWQ